MESIIVLFANLVLMILNCIQSLAALYPKTLLSIRQSDPAIINLLNVIKDCTLVYLEGFNFMFTLRFILMWFPNVNPFIQPFYIVHVVTQPFYEHFQKWVPRLFGIDFSFLVCSYAITYTINFLTKLKF